MSLCPNGEEEVSCSDELCSNTTCEAVPEAKCVVDNCGTCTVKWYNEDDVEVTIQCQGRYNIENTM